MKRSLLFSLVLCFLFVPSAAQAVVVPSADPVAGQYIVVLRDDAARGGQDPANSGPSVGEVANSLALSTGATVTYVVSVYRSPPLVQRVGSMPSENLVSLDRLPVWG